MTQTVDSSPAAVGSAVTTSTAADLLAALRAIVKRLEQTPIPADKAKHEAWAAAPPAPRHIAALMQIVSEDRMSVTTLSTRLGVSLPTASQVVTDLEAAGLVERLEDPTDRRRTLVRVADNHRALAAAVLETRLRPVQRALDRLKPAEQRAVVRGLELIAEELERTDV